MARNLGLEIGVNVPERIRVEAAKLFQDRGYGSTTIRDIAKAADISSSTMYHHYRNKQDVLFAISQQFMVDFNAALLPALTDDGCPPAERLDQAIRLHLVISSDRRDELLTIRGNRSALSHEQLMTVVGLQHVYRNAVRDAVSALSDPGASREDDELTTTALIDLINGVSNWFDDSGRLSIDEVAERYIQMAHSLIAGSARSHEDSRGSGHDSSRAP